MIQFQENHFTYDKKRREFFRDEPDTLLGDRIARTDVTKFRVSQGWTQITTIAQRGRLDRPGAVQHLRQYG